MSESAKDLEIAKLKLEISRLKRRRLGSSHDFVRYCKKEILISEKARFTVANLHDQYIEDLAKCLGKSKRYHEEKVNSERMKNAAPKMYSTLEQIALGVAVGSPLYQNIVDLLAEAGN